VKQLVPARHRPMVRRLLMRSQKVHPREVAELLRVLRAKAEIVNRYQGFRQHPLAALRYLLVGRELANFTYDIDNRTELAEVIGRAVRKPTAEVLHYIGELDRDVDLRARLSARSREAGRAGIEYGRRLGWYAVIRLLKPELVVETGVDAGLGSAVLLRALERNTEEGVAGRLVSVDIRPHVGQLVDDPLREWWTLETGDSVVFLEGFGPAQVGMFVQDSAHTHEHETSELEAVARLAVPGAVLVSDNAHGTALADFSKRHDLNYHVFIERPLRHFYPGSALGIARLPGKECT
jgi:predicted O-methyltransferase YrrM